jgi:hypothetical protein
MKEDSKMKDSIHNILLAMADSTSATGASAPGIVSTANG